MVYDAWEQLNESLKESLGLSNSDCVVRAYQGLAPAIWEITQATAQFYSHKRKYKNTKGFTRYKPGNNTDTVASA